VANLEKSVASTRGKIFWNFPKKAISLEKPAFGISQTRIHRDNVRERGCLPQPFHAMHVYSGSHARPQATSARSTGRALWPEGESDIVSDTNIRRDNIRERGCLSQPLHAMHVYLRGLKRGPGQPVREALAGSLARSGVISCLTRIYLTRPILGSAADRT